MIIWEYLNPNRDENIYDEILPIENPFEAGDAQQGFNAALGALAAALFGKGGGGQDGPKPDPRLIQPPTPPSQKNNNNKDNNNNNNNKNNVVQGLTDEQLDDLINKVKAARNAADDVINDDDISQATANKIDQELDDLEDEAENAETQSDANKINARLKAIADFWDEDTLKSARNDTSYRRLSTEIRKQAAQARRNANKRNYNYKPLTITEIINKIINTLKSESKKVRDSSWSRYNARARSLGYYAPGRYTRETPNKIPKVVFYFDVSGSWSGDKEKIDMGHRIEEALKVLEQQKKIELYCYYFGTKVHDKFTTTDGGNSDAPVPHALELLNAGELDNIIIMTDNNPCSDQKLNVPGYAWLLFYDSVSESLATNVSGKKGTSIVMIDHSKEN